MPKPTNENSRDYRNALGKFATGITIVTTQVEDRIHGMTCNAFLSISLSPALVAISVTHKAKMHAFLQESGRFGVSILSADQEALSSHFAGQPQESVVDPFTAIEGLPMIKEANAYLVTKVVNQFDIGDHTLFVGEVEHFDYVSECEPLLYSGGRYAFLAK